jgi:serine/threonine protein phosphatase PrpC
MLDVVYGQASEAGRVRPHNEDAATAFVPRSRHETRSRGWMFAVADGAGGRNLGEVASAKAIAVMLEGFSQSAEGVSLASLLPRLIQQANAAVHDVGLSPGRRGRHMATTVVLCALRHDKAVVAHVGNSRCYHIRDGRANQLTSDHTWLTEQREQGIMTAAEAEQSEKRHDLTRSLGPKGSVSVDTGSVSLKPGDVLVLCTDGLYGAMYIEDIARIVSQNKDAETVARELVDYAVEADGSDNATAQVVQVLATDPMEIYRGRLHELHLPESH